MYWIEFEYCLDQLRLEGANRKRGRRRYMFVCWSFSLRRWQLKLRSLLAVEDLNALDALIGLDT